MLKEQATVIHYAQGIATIQIQRQASCLACSEKKACGTALLGELTTEVQHKHTLIFHLPCLTPLRIGQRLEIGLRKKVFLLSSLLLYATPLISLLFATLITPYFFSQELLQAGFIFICVGISFFAIKLLSPTLLHHPHYHIVLLRILS